jgi:hypothetical protein
MFRQPEVLTEAEVIAGLIETTAKATQNGGGLVQRPPLTAE